MARMLGRTHEVGFGGRRCACCYEAPGKGRKVMNRSAKRRERARVKKEVWV